MLQNRLRELLALPQLSLQQRRDLRLESGCFYVVDIYFSPLCAQIELMEVARKLFMLTTDARLAVPIYNHDHLPSLLEGKNPSVFINGTNPEYVPFTLFIDEKANTLNSLVAILRQLSNSSKTAIQSIAINGESILLT
jgi:hypothetical protein